MKKKLFVAILTLGFLSLAVAPVLAADAVTLDIGINDINKAGNMAGFTQSELPVIVGNIIKVVLGILGLLALILIVVAGFQWMTSGGNEEKIGGAKKLMSAGVIGLVIILIAYAATTYIVTKLQPAF